MGGRSGDEKIKRAFVAMTMPLLDVWISACDLDDVEAEILRLKRFDDSSPTEDEILEILQEKFGYYYTERQFRRHWKRIQKKIESIIP